MGVAPSLPLQLLTETHPSIMGDEDKQAVIDAKKAEVRARLEAQAAGKKLKKGFMTPERKKKLRLLLRKKAAEELKKEQERKAAERRKVIDERCGQPKDVDNASEGVVRDIAKKYHERIIVIENQKYAMEKELEIKEFQINELNIAVNDLRGKFIKPTLKKVSKYENKLAKLQKKAAEFNFRNQLKTVKKKEFTMDEEEAGKKKPDWVLGAKEGEAKVEKEPEPSAQNDEATDVAADQPNDAPEEMPADIPEV